MVDWRVLISLASWKRKRGPKTGSAVLYSAKSGLKRLPRGLQAVFIAVQEMKNKKADQSAGKARLFATDALPVIHKTRHHITQNFGRNLVLITP